MKKNGFTLIELLAVIVIIAIITVVGLASFSFTKDTNIKNESTETTVERAINVYYQNLYKNNKLKYNKTTTDGVSTMEFCVKLDNLVKNGYLNQDNIPTYGCPTADEKDKKCPFTYAIIKKRNEEMEYQFTNDENACKKTKTNISSVKNENSPSEGQIGEEADVNKYSFSQSITQIDTDSYKVESNFSIKVSFDITSYVPIYTVMVLDRSSSMSGTPISNAVAAIKNMTEQFANINKEYENETGNRPVYCTSVVQFESSASLETKFTDAIISPGTSAPGGTYYAPGLTLAENVLNNKLENSSSELCKNYANAPKVLNFIIFLSDGSPGDSFNSTFKSITERIKQNGTTIFTISYGSSNNNNLKCMASRAYSEDEEKEENDYVTCTSLSDSSNFIGYNSTGSTGQKRVYYFETSISEDSLNAVLQKFSDEAGKMSKSTEYDIATINYTLNSHYFENQKDSSKNTIIKSYNLTDKDIIKDGYVTGITDFNIRLKDIIINENTEIPLFNSITIDLIDNEAVVENKTITIPEANIPKVNAYKYIDTLVN